MTYEKEQYDDIIRKTYPFDLLTEEQYKKIITRSERIVFHENEFVFHEEDEEVEVYFLLKGLAKNVLHRDNGEQFSVRFYYPGDLIGMLMLLAGGQMNFSVQALETCDTVLFKKNDLLKVMSENKTFSDVILSGIGSRMKSLYDEIKKERSVSQNENISLFRTRVRTIMEKARTISNVRTLNEAAKTLLQCKTSGLVVVNEKQELFGVLTQQQVIQGLMEGKESDLVTKWMDCDPICTQENAFSYEVLTFFKDDHIDLVPVLSNQSVVGVLTAEAFLQLQDSKYINLSYRLNHAFTLKELKALSPKNNEDFYTFTEALLNERTYPTEVCELISNYNDKIHRQVIKFAINEMKEEGFGKPPINFCFIVMGSQGRKEQAFSTDQDNGFILDDYEHLPNKTQIEEYFLHFAKKINDGLAESGFPECTGGIMAKEKKWTRSLSQWVREVEHWLREADAEEVRDFTIFIDYRPVYGDFQLGYSLREEVTKKIQHAKMMHAMLMKDTIRFRVPISPLGRISARGKERSIDLKKQGMMQIVNGVRIFAIKYGIKQVSTLERLSQLQEKEVFHPRDVKNAKLALDYLHEFRLKEHMSQLRNSAPLTNDIHTATLTKDEKKQLKEALLIAKRLQQMSELSFAKNRGI
ncbi:DUF294 nucleotidyltransferase-like domain-containing protein [Bacillus shivajii]|uniref:DUF294 nucleotidyltransferase-like domain-containing protein n=1 Tax=Bacillus shivajii TaxID=1983719 RepID=UPI001CFA0607|nr:DUF294 nucleotidyltransferase-like domain-containing protein [Bacillus shivajii]UCZ51503.1 DUF294 nucleotidyltransferase-like domain-containing protein [Bacillus shivajii]